MSQAEAGLDPLFFAFQEALAGRYSIDRELGRGGMGVVYLAREVHLDRMVAIKLLPPEQAADESRRGRFLGEARLAAKLSHPNIIPIHTVEENRGFVFYVMAFVDGETLAERVRIRGPLSSSEGTRILREVSWALAYAHGQGLVHRDVKPDNILLESSTGRVLVADFGIAAAAGDVHSGAIVGTPEFMSPEQALGGVIDARSDLYSLGATAFFAFSGQFPFDGASSTEILAKQVTEPAPPLGSLGLTVPRKLALIVDRCLAKEPDQRPESANTLAEQLGLALEQRRELPLALRAFVKRRGRISTAGVLLPSLLLTVVIALLSIYAQLANGLLYFVGIMALTLMSYLVIAARQLLLQGYDHQDLAPAFKIESEQAREELGEERRPVAKVAVRLLGSVSRIATGVALILGTAEAFFPFTLVQMFGRSGVVETSLSIAILTAILTRYIWQTLRRQSADIDTESWGRVWHSRFGRSIFWFARKLTGNRRPASAMTHRATELSLGMAAEQLFESLPKESRQHLKELPKVLQRLQRDAQALRKRYDELQEVLNGSSDGSVSNEVNDLRAIRDAVHGKLSEAVGAMETIRLNLLRLHAGSIGVSGVTTHLELARDLSAEVERVVEAHEEVDLMLRFPRVASAT